jgi:Kef-type K+ transport system membrane component KefB
MTPLTPFLQLALALVILITVAKLGGYASIKLGQPSVLGELIAGLIIGPSVLNMLHWPFFTNEHLGETVAQLAELGVLLLMFIAGLDLHLNDLAQSSKVSALAGTLGVIFPVGMGYGLARLFGLEALPALFIGLILAATSVSISAQTLIELNVLRSRVGIGLLGAAVFDDILVVLGLSVLVALASDAGGSLAGVGLIVLWMGLYLAGAIFLGLWLIPGLTRRIDNWPISQGIIAFTFTVCLLYAWAAEVVGGMAAITGAFVAGLMFGRSPLKSRIEAGISTLAYGVFVPIFFVNIGLSANARELTGESLWLVATMIVAAIISKILGAGLGARLSGFTNLESLQLGVGMMSRGEVGLIVAALGIRQQIIEPGVFSAVVGVVIVTTLLTPPALRSLFRRDAPMQMESPTKTTQSSGGE